ncbi:MULTISPECIES: 3-hydroxybutyrate oligomer hydrolase family protein [unclassified Rhizobacter]|uniref:3-hydroxybutyrate oligomer hydrolase family protein n=1 Tax=unclassified Rhizobacter TaxID=2640088 RepID=UPI0006F37612|nr:MULTISPECIES: 3-hydroxybutyrate oligomer hydrolase family protein [unclassified Rhizobacter]KQU75005.1 hydrogenase [Rhizobacter sp. Root29]KQW00920.1 hydrogenase [Rhizobacter sp. Root1238]KRB09215.1 hydrogenase [Rhizobacter sp. Root16D2]
MKSRLHSLNPSTLAALGLSALALAGCGSDDDTPLPVNALPANVSQLTVTTYPATTAGSGSTAATQDLLTGGLGKTGLGAAAPTYADPLNPTAAELRRNALFSDYRGLVDVTAAGGYGTLYGPNVDAAGTVTTNEGLIPGREYVAVLDNAAGTKRVAIAVQIPDSFSTAAPCVVLGPSSGSRGVYGAIATSAEWGLKHGCAVALTDAGKGMGLYDLTDDTVNRIDGTRATRNAAGALNFFAAAVTDAARAAYNALTPNRLALKQVHSQLNPEKDWGNDTLAAAAYALYALNDRYGNAAAPVPFTAANTIVIAGSVSNGGAAVIRAAEADSTGLIDGVVAGEPVTEMPTRSGYGIQFGGAAVAAYGKTLGDFTTYGNLYQPCAALAAEAALTETSFFNYIGLTAQTARATARCTGLAAKGLVTGADTAAQSLDALNKLRAYGWTTDNDTMHNAHYALGNGPILSAMYPVMYGRFSVLDNVCGTSFAQVDASGNPIAVAVASKAQSFAIGNGTANGAPASVVYNDSVGGAKQWAAAVSVSTGVQDFGLDNALCQRALVTGVDETGAALTATATSTRPTAAQAAAVQAGMAEVLVNGNLRAKPALVVAGRSDALVPVNNNARAYVAFNKTVEAAASRLGYIEVTNAQHFDGFLSLSGFDTRFVPLHVYFNRAMDAMYAHLKTGAALPLSQVVRATPRGGLPGAAPAITAANVPTLSAAPLVADQIGFAGTSVAIPN